MEKGNVYQAQKLSLLAIRRIEIIRDFLSQSRYNENVASYCFLKRELKKQQVLRDKVRRAVKKLIDKEEKVASLPS